jgi:hypothetical protein
MTEKKKKETKKEIIARYDKIFEKYQKRKRENKERLVQRFCFSCGRVKCNCGQ